MSEFTGQLIGAIVLLVTTLAGIIRSQKAASTASEESATIIKAVTKLAEDMSDLRSEVSGIRTDQAVTVERLTAFDKGHQEAQRENREAHGRLWEELRSMDVRVRIVEGRK